MDGTLEGVESDPTGRYIRYNTVLGRGSYKVVYKAFDTFDAIEVAWNKLQVERISTDQMEKVQKEVELLNRVSHKNIISLYATWKGFDAEGKPTMDFATELMMSGTLKQYLKRARAVKLKVIRRWCHNLLEGIAYLHDQRPAIMHRDLKCDNIFINGHVGEVKIGDLGLSGVKEHAVAQSVIGTPEFMAPELYEESYTEKVDIYAFGMCMLEMVTMEYPYSECSNPAQIFRKVFAGEKPNCFKKLVNCEVKAVIAACLERESKRPSARQLLTHPLFSEWEDDDGVSTNLSLLAQMTPRNSMRNLSSRQGVSAKSTAYKQGMSRNQLHTARNGPGSDIDSFQELKPGQSMVFNSQTLHKEVLIAREALQNNDNFSRVSVASVNDRGELRLTLTLPVKGEAKKIEFFFDPSLDNVDEIATEIVEEFRLDSKYIEILRGDISEQIQEQQAPLQQDKYAASFGGNAMTSGKHRGGARGQSRIFAREDVHRAVNSGSHRSSRSSYNRDEGSSFHNSYSNEPEHGNAHSSSSMGNSDAGQCAKSLRNKNDKLCFRTSMALMKHSANGNYNLVKQKLGKGAPATFTDFDRRTPLHLAAMEGHLDVVHLLLENGADVNAEDRWACTPIMEAQKNGHDEIVKVLEKAGAESHESATMSATTILSMEMMQYVADGYFEMVREKLIAGADAKFADHDERTPLHIACAESHLDVAKLLLVNGADPMVRDRFGVSPMDEAVHNANTEMMQLLKQFGGCLPFHLLNKDEAAYQYGLDLVEHSSRGRVDYVRYLLEQGADVGYADYDKRTALHLACAEGQIEVAAELIRAGADPEAKDRWGATPIDEAKKNVKEGLMEAIQQAVADRQELDEPQ